MQEVDYFVLTKVTKLTHECFYRQRTTSGGQQFMVVGGTAGSPPKYVSLEEIMAAANGLQDMALVHQIAVDKDFKLTKPELQENSFEKQVRDTMHRAFWDVLKEEINQKPPKYTQVLTNYKIKQRIRYKFKIFTI